MGVDARARANSRPTAHSASDTAQRLVWELFAACTATVYHACRTSLGTSSAVSLLSRMHVASLRPSYTVSNIHPLHTNQPAVVAWCSVILMRS